MVRVIPTWTIEYKFGPSEVSQTYRVNADSMFEALQHFLKLNHGVQVPVWLRVQCDDANRWNKQDVTTVTMASATA